MYSILKNINFNKESQEDTLKTIYKVIEDIEERITIINRNSNNTKVQEFQIDKINNTIKDIYFKMVFSLSGWATDQEVSNLINKFNTLTNIKIKKSNSQRELYINGEIKEYPQSYITRVKPSLGIPTHVREFKIKPRLFNTPIGNIYVTPAQAPKTGFGSSTKIVFINDMEGLNNGVDLSRCKTIKTIQPSKVLEYLEKDTLNEKINSMLEKIVYNI